MKLVLHWFRRDLRIHDNTAFTAALGRAEKVLPVFVLEEPAFRRGPDVGAARLEFLLASARELQRSLAARGYPLVLRRGRSEEELPRLCQETGAQAVFCNRRTEPYAQARDERLHLALNQIGVGLEVYKDAVLWEEREILTQQGNPYTVFTPYSKSWRKKRGIPPAPVVPRTRSSFPKLKSDPWPASAAELGFPCSQLIFPGGEAAGRKRWEEFKNTALSRYAEGRDEPFRDGTSKLSAHLRAGTIGIRELHSDLAKIKYSLPSGSQRDLDSFVTELIWREFYAQVLSNFPHVMKGAFTKNYDRLIWTGHDAHFQVWAQGGTGYPIVDAAMRCLSATGWMHNRLRMIVAMFFTKDLLLHWQQGERYFMQQLVDGDLAANNGGWQWSAGTGTDAAPYFRIFNPTLQGKKFDPDGDFIRTWIPELNSVATRFIHEPWLASASERKGYPERIVRHDEQKPKVMEMFKKVRG